MYRVAYELGVTAARVSQLHGDLIARGKADLGHLAG
jgi:hypothetical protein